MWAEINGERKKVACGPCIRGHRSSKCDHRDRVLVEVRKPGRPLSSCPHPSGSCSCERVVINYTIPKTSECACPSERAQAQSVTSPSSGPVNRVQKPRARKGTQSINPASLEKAIKASQDVETDSSSLLTRTPTNPSFAPSEKTASNEASPPSSASSTPRILPSPSRKQSYSSDFQLPDASAVQSNPVVSDCCKPKPTVRQPDTLQQPQPRLGGSCCSSKVQESPIPPPPKNSCCSGPSQPKQAGMDLEVHTRPDTNQNLASLVQYQQHAQLQSNGYGPIHAGYNFNSAMGMSGPIGFNTPIYNHMAAVYQHAPPSLPMPPTQSGPGHSIAQGMDHNCHCGDTCSCFGCAAHPHNATMTEYVRLMDQYMRTGGFGALPPPTYDLPSYPHHPGYGAESTHPMAFHPTTSSSAFPSLVGFHNSMSVPSTPLAVSTPWQPQQALIAAPNQGSPLTDTQYFNPVVASLHLETKNEESASAQSPAVTDSPQDVKEEDTPTLSPSAYFWNELVLPGCNDETGTCQCGDGCECVGCLTHGGHNGVPLTDPVTTGPESFSDFLATTDMGDTRNHFVHGTFPNEPT
ncbi:hypothetical protein B0J11DRAFT_232524 [Dendryphion nanum]|uniref:Copper-fist domain-containing protein n=1 Tax=Dendryphion nanum TaxID=256645 RepID=A0A9P9E576_9PLEO|nr:hypothetical protein B0J11DRAFT_232524 [Dendryphion nanum]